MRRSAWYRHRIAARVTTITTALILAVGLVGHWRAEWLAPGPLTQPHAQILSGDLRSERCASCHPAAKGGLQSWFLTGKQSHAGVQMTDHCLDCHHTRFDATLARNPHNLPPSLLAQKTRLVASPNPSQSHLLPHRVLDQIECAACHQEHRGAKHDLTFVSNQQCQTCHATSFTSFSQGHPEFTDWPYGESRHPIRFSHQSHASEHFPKSNHSFACINCHAPGPTGEQMQTATFENACASCHSDSLKTKAADGFALLAFPIVPEHLITETNLTSRWPIAARGLTSGRIPPVTQLLLSVDPNLKASLRRTAQRDWEQLNIASDAELQKDVMNVIRGIVNLNDEIATHGQTALVDRLRRLKIDESTTQRFAGQFSVNLARDSALRWATEPPPIAGQMSIEKRFRLASAGHEDEQQSKKDTLLDTDPLLFGDPEPGSPSTGPTPPAIDDPLGGILSPQNEAPADRPPLRLNPDHQLSVGGWYRDDIQLAYRYRPSGHADSHLRALIEIAITADTEPAVRESILQLPASQSCLECHNIESTTSVSWDSPASTAAPGRFTRFSHQPHLNIRQLSDCASCHVIQESESGTTSPANRTDRHDFEPMHKFHCAACHTSRAAGDSCMQCHRYHIDLASEE